jgi:hypothetical protein
MQGLTKRLRAGRLSVSFATGVAITDESGAVIDQIAPETIAASDWGIVYERWVGLELEREGWEIDYRGLSLGWSDQGIDLIATRETATRYLQCKFLTRSLGKQQIEQLLYTASGFLTKQELVRGDVFELVVPSIEAAFPSKRKKSKPAQQNWLKAKFLNHNYTQNRIRLGITEIPMDSGSRVLLPATSRLQQL